MTRSLYKLSNFLPFSSITSSANRADSARLKTLFNKSFFKKKPELIINRTNRLVSPPLEGKRVAIYNGNSLNSFILKKSMVGLSFKTLVRTKKLGSLIHVEKRSKKKKAK